jgi:hypothetical protein
MPQIMVENLVKTFRVSERAAGLWGAVCGVVHRRYRTVRALDGVSFALDDSRSNERLLDDGEPGGLERLHDAMAWLALQIDAAGPISAALVATAMIVTIVQLLRLRKPRPHAPRLN